MLTLGLLGGMSWESTLEYYRIMNREVRSALGRSHSAKMLLYSVDFEEIDRLMHRSDWERVESIMIDIARRLVSAGAEKLVICTNTIHLVAEKLEEATGIEVIHIADSTGKAVVRDGFKKVGLLGTRFTMEKDFYKRRLKERFGIETIVPAEEDRIGIHDIIFTELINGIINQGSRDIYIEIISRLVADGAEGIILGCTEIPLLVRQTDVAARLYDTTALHAKDAVAVAIGR